MFDLEAKNNMKNVLIKLSLEKELYFSISFIGTGLILSQASIYNRSTLTISVDGGPFITGPAATNIVSGLPFGTHVVKIKN